jgi:septum formation protein
LQRAGFAPLVRPVDVDESHNSGEGAVALVERLAQAKAASIDQPEYPVLAGDTVVSLQQQLLGKPADSKDARRMLESLSGREHQVTSGWCIRWGSEAQVGHVVTLVRFKSLSSSQIDAYLETAEPFDKAGAYGIQGQGRALVEEVRGSWSNVVGLPLCPVVRLLRELTER